MGLSYKDETERINKIRRRLLSNDNDKTSFENNSDQIANTIDDMVKVACILDDFSFSTFKDDCVLIQLSPLMANRKSKLQSQIFYSLNRHVAGGNGN